MATIVILLELEPSTEVLDAGEVDIGARVRFVHAAAADPTTPDDPTAHTFCGLDTDVMERENYRPAAPGEPWYPPEYAGRRCRVCDAALHSL